MGLGDKIQISGLRSRRSIKLMAGVSTGVDSATSKSSPPKKPSKSSAKRQPKNRGKKKESILLHDSKVGFDFIFV